MIKKIFLVALVIEFCFSLTACLQTRSELQEVEQKRLLQDNVVSLQRSNADISSRFNEIETDIRHINGKIEVLDNRIEKLSKDKDKSIQTTN